MVSIRQYRAGDEKGIQRLRRQVFGDLDPVRLKEATWHWQFQRNPAGQAFCAVAEDRGRIIGQYAAIPTRFRVQGREVRFALSCDTMIHPAYKKQGLFTDLARVLYRRIESVYGIRTVWGFPNKASLPGFTKHLNWHILKVYPLWIIPLRPIAIIQGLLHLMNPRFKGRDSKVYEEAEKKGQSVCIDLLQGLEIQALSHFSEEFDSLWHRYRGLAPVIQIRNAKYLNWRYFEVPGFGYKAFAIRKNSQLAGYLILRVMTLMGHVFGVLTDLFPFPVQDVATTKKVFRFARSYCRAVGAEFMTCLISRTAPSFLRGRGFIHIPDLLNPRPCYFGLRDVSGDTRTISVPENWYLTYGDMDIV